MSRSEPEVTSRIVSLMLTVAYQRGLDVPALARRWGLPPDLDLDPGQLTKADLTLNAATLRGLSEEIAERLGDPFLGLMLAVSTPRGTYGVGEFLIRSAPTLRAAFRNLLRFNRLITPTNSFQLLERDGEAQLHHVPVVPGAVVGRHFNEYVSALMVGSLRTMAELPLARTWFMNPAPTSTEPLVQAFGTQQMSFDQPTNGFSFEAHRLDLPVRGADPALFLFLEQHALTAFAALPKADDLIERLRVLIRESLEQGEPNVERLSMRLKMSARTLQRRLAELQTSFQDVLSAVRFELARAFLGDSRLDLSQIAYLLGYSELRAFDRAFKRWSGATPGDFRAQLG
jgi:AraC-like DNA-binding protein